MQAANESEFWSLSKVIYCGFGRKYFNPNLNLIPKLFAATTQCVFYGPGYSESLCSKELTEFLERNQFSPDFLVIDMDMFGFEFFGDKFLRGSAMGSVKANLAEYLQCARDLLQAFRGRTLLYCNFDYYHAPKALIKKIEEENVAVISRDIGFWREKSELEFLSNETFCNSVNDNWYHFIRENPQSVISFPGIISDSELRYDPWDEKVNKISVAGVKYFHRKKILKSKLPKGLSFETGDIRRKVVSKILQASGSEKAQRLYQKNFQELIHSTKFGYTCGSALGFPLRKFLEIPAAGSLLLCEPFLSIENFGFVDGEHYRKVGVVDIADVVDDALINQFQTQSMIRRSQYMLASRHAFGPRQVQLQQVLSAMKDKTFAGSAWISGEFKINEK